MNKYLIVCLLFISFSCIGQKDSRLSVIDFVQIIDDNKVEVIYYYENNWKVLREMALERGYIHSFELLETPYSENAPFHIMLVTSFRDKAQYDLSESNFEVLIEEKGPLKLMNNKRPGEFRKIVFSKDNIRHLD